MARTVLDDAQWASVMLVIQRIPHAWKQNEAKLRRFVEAVLWIDRKRCSVTLGCDDFQGGCLGAQCHGISSSMRFCGQPFTNRVSRSVK